MDRYKSKENVTFYYLFHCFYFSVTCQKHKMDKPNFLVMADENAFYFCLSDRFRALRS